MLSSPRHTECARRNTSEKNGESQRNTRNRPRPNTRGTESLQPQQEGLVPRRAHGSWCRGSGELKVGGPSVSVLVGDLTAGLGGCNDKYEPSKTTTKENGLVQNQERVCQGCVVTLLIS